MFTAKVSGVSLAAAAQGSDCGVFQIGWALQPPVDGAIRNLYWATTNYTELWMTVHPLQPAIGKPGVPDLLLVFSVCYAGKTMPSPRREAEIRVQVNRGFIPALVPDPQLLIKIDETGWIDLLGPNFKHSTEYPSSCSPGTICAYTAVLVNVPVALLRQMALATDVAGTLSGTPSTANDLRRQSSCGLGSAHARA